MNEKLLLQDLVVLLSEKSKISQKEADRFLRELFQLILECIYESDFVKIKDLGTFKLIKINARESVDVNTGEKIEIPAHYKMSFAADKSLKKLVNKPFAQFESVVLEDDDEMIESENKERDSNSSDEDVNLTPNNDSEGFIKEDIESPDDIEKASQVIEDNLPTEGTLNESVIEEADQSSVEDSDSQVDSKVEVEGEEKKEEGKSKKFTIDLIEVNMPSRALRERLEKEQAERLKASASRKIPLLEIKERPRRSLTLDKEAPVDSVLPEKDVLEQEEDTRVVNTNIESKVEESLADAPPVTVPTEKKEPEEEKRFFSKPKKVDTKKTVEERLPVEDESAADIDYNELARKARKKRKKYLIAIGVVVLVFAAYQFIKLFDVTYDYEYYIDRVPNLTLSDTLPMIDQEIVTESDYNEPLFQENDGISNKSESLPPVSDDIISEKIESNIDELSEKIKLETSNVKQGQKISDNLSIKIVNKAQVYLEGKNK